MSSLPSLGPRGEGWVVIQGVLLVGIGVAGLTETPFTPDAWTATSAAGLVLLAVGGMLAVLGVRHLGGALTPLPHPRRDAELVETGVYRYVRHPIYGGLIVAALGYGLLMHALVTAIGGALLLLVFFRLKSGREEAWLEQRYAGYVAYRRQTRRFIPFIY